MPIIHAIVLGITQGLSEFLPISSSGHLILVPWLFQWTELTQNPDLNKTFDVALHMGTFVGAFAYFRADILRYAGAAISSLRHRRIRTIDERLAWLLALTMIPGAVLGAALESAIEDHLGKPWLIGVMLIVFGLVLLAADRLVTSRSLVDLSRRDALFMGLAQAVALQPGVSRSGVTITVARWLRLDRDSAARFSFLMSMPIIFGAGVKKGLTLLTDGFPPGTQGAFLWGTIASALTGFLAVWGILRVIRTRGFVPFVIYRCLAGTAVIVIAASGWR